MFISLHWSSTVRGSVITLHRSSLIRSCLPYICSAERISAILASKRYIHSPKNICFPGSLTFPLIKHSTIGWTWWVRRLMNWWSISLLSLNQQIAILWYHLLTPCPSLLVQERTKPEKWLLKLPLKDTALQRTCIISGSNFTP